MDIYAEIRKLHREVISERAIARKLRIHRKTVHKYMDGSIMPGERLNPPERTATVLTQEVKDFVAQCIEQDDQEGTKKQHHTAKSIEWYNTKRIKIKLDGMSPVEYRLNAA